MVSEHDDLFFMIYEKLPVRTGDVQPALWRYRARITLEHLSHALQQSTNKSLAILKEFLRLVNITIPLLINTLLLNIGTCAKDY